MIKSQRELQARRACEAAISGKLSKAAAIEFAVPETSIYRARQVIHRCGIELAREVMAGRLSLAAAFRRVPKAVRRPSLSPAELNAIMRTVQRAFRG